jgi:pimeloyl-ACP methyl ester carboxylesterase
MAFDLQTIPLPTGVTLDVAVAGDPADPAIILLHGFPESHRTWRHQIPELAKDHFVLAPDQRGFARSSKPAEVSDYTPDKMVGDLIALADHFGVGKFTLVGHDWGGAIAWMAALTRPDRVERLIIVNAPHPFVFQKTMFDDPGQREASQYIRAFRNPEFEKYIDSIGLPAFFDGSFMRHTDFGNVAAEKDAYLNEWGQPGAMTAMAELVPGEQHHRARDGRRCRAPRLSGRALPADRTADSGDLGHGRQGIAAEPARGTRRAGARHDAGEDRCGAFRAVGSACGSDQSDPGLAGLKATGFPSGRCWRV